jgi:hypothetical protein
MSKPVIHQNVMYQLLHEERIEEFNQRRAAGETAHLADGSSHGHKADLLHLCLC